MCCCSQAFLTKALMPLHKPKCVGMYHQQLAYCVTQVWHLYSAISSRCQSFWHMDVIVSQSECICSLCPKLCVVSELSVCTV